MDGADIIKTLIELLEAQEQIKITYTLGDIEELNERKTISTSEQSITRDSKQK